MPGRPEKSKNRGGKDRHCNPVKEIPTPFCLAENLDFKPFDLCYSFKALVCVEYGGFASLHEAAWNYQNNWVAAFNHSEDARMSYEKGLQNLIVFLFAHYIEAFECHGARQGYWAILVLECLTAADELARYHRWYKRANLWKPRIEKTHWKDLASAPMEDHQSSYISGLAALGSPKQPSYRHPQVLSRYFDHVYHQSRNVGQLTRKAWDKMTDYNETVYTRELGEILSYLRGLDDLNHSTRHKRTPTSLLNPDINLPEAAFQAFRGKNTGWLDKDSWAEGEKVEHYEHDRLQTRVDWCGNPEELVRTNDTVDQKDHKSMYLEDYPEDMLDLEETMSTGTSVYDRLGATPANTMMSTDTEAAGDMFNLSMGPPEMPESHWQDEPNASCSGAALSDDEQFNNMFKVPSQVPECQDQVNVTQPGLNFRALITEAQFKSGQRLLPPPLELRLQRKDDKDMRNMELQAKTAKREEVPVSNPRNRDPLDLDRDANRDAALEHMRERHQKESCSSSTTSRSSSTSKRHWSASRSGDEINPKKGHPTPDREHSTPDKGNTPPRQESPAPACKFTLNWDQDILEPLKPKWRPAAKDTLATPQHKVKSIVKSVDSAAPAKIASCGKGRGRVITEKLKEIAMDPAASSRYTGKDDVPKKTTPKKPGFLTREEMEAHRRREAQKDWVVNHQEESISERYFSIRQQVGRFAQEVKTLRFFEPEGKETDLVC